MTSGTNSRSTTRTHSIESARTVPPPNAGVAYLPGCNARIRLNRQSVRIVDGFKRAALDLGEYSTASRLEPCFICRVVDGSHPVPHEVIYRDEFAIAFLNRFPTLYGNCLVAPVTHRVDVVGDFDDVDYLRLQTIVRRVARAVNAAVPTERTYLLSLGSNQGNAHVHWHVAPLPPGVAYEDQQFKALMIESNGYIQLDAAQQHQLADALRTALTDGEGEQRPAIELDP
jgi:diadenosine tetraphosphate (Ap4A) HIT family hydrolase